MTLPFGGADDSQNIFLRVYLGSDGKVFAEAGEASYIGVTQVREPNAKPIRVPVPHTGSTFVEAINIPVVEQGDMTAEFFCEKADATHLAMRQLLVTRPAPKLWYEVVHVPFTEGTDDELNEAAETVLSRFKATCMDFPRTAQERQALKGTIQLQLDSIPEYDPD